jgi:uncharacterized protein involved in outer membrane biogenesis
MPPQTFHYFRHHKWLALMAAVVGVVLLALLLIIIFSEPLLRSLTESQGSKRLGRELVIEGDLRVKWRIPYTHVHVEKLRLANAEGYAEPDMATIETLDFSFKPLKLLVGKLEFGDITLIKPRLILEQKSPEENNWQFPLLSSANVAQQAIEPDDRHDFPLIGMLELREGKVIYRDHIKGLFLNLDLDTVVGEGGEKKRQRPDRNFVIAGAGSIQDQPFKLEASGESLETLRDSTRDYPLKLRLIMGKTEVAVDGKFRDPIKMTVVDASLNIGGDNMANLFYLTAIPLPPTPRYNLAGQLTKKDGIWGYEAFNGSVGDSDLSGNLTYDTRGERGFLKADLTSELLDSEDLGGFIGLPPSGDDASPEQNQAAAEKAASPNLIPDVPLTVERLRATDLDVTLHAARIEAPNVPIKSMDVRFDLRNGLLKLDPMKVALADGTVEGTVEVDARQDTPPMKMDLILRKLSLGQFFAGTRFAETTDGLFGGKIILAGRGASLAEVLASSNGELVVVMVGGKISLLLMEAADLDLGQALPLLLGKDKSTRIRCGLADFNVEDGLLTSDVVLLDTDDSLLVGNVTIDMKDEIINAKLDAKPKDTSLLALRVPVVVSGRLKEPKVGLDAERTLSRGVAAVALGALLTPFAAILPFIESGDAENADCRALLK